MATKRVYVGSLGPHLYDDTDLATDPDDTFAGYTREGIMLDGQIILLEDPTDDKHVIRLEDKLDGIIEGVVDADIALLVNQSVMYPRKVTFSTGSLTIPAGAWASVI